MFKGIKTALSSSKSADHSQIAAKKEKRQSKEINLGGNKSGFASKEMLNLSDQFAKAIASLPPPLKSLLNSPLTRGIKPGEPASTLTRQIYAELSKIIESDEKLLADLVEVFRLAFLHFHSFLSYLTEHHLKSPMKGYMTEDRYELLSGGIRLTSYIWPHCEFLKFKTELARMNIFLPGIFMYNFTILVDEEDIKRRKEQKKLAAFVVNELPHPQKYFYNACNQFLELLKGLYREHPQTYELIQRYVAFWAEFALVQRNMTIRLEEIFLNHPPPIKLERPAPGPSRGVVLHMDPNNLIKKEGYRYLMNILKENFIIETRP